MHYAHLQTTLQKQLDVLQFKLMHIFSLLRFGIYIVCLLFCAFRSSAQANDEKQ